MSWARAALDRNERLSVVATDPKARTFTVKLKDSAQLRVIPLDQIVAGPAGGFEAASAPRDTTAESEGAAPAPANGDLATPASSSNEAGERSSTTSGSVPGGRVASTQPVRPSEQSAENSEGRAGADDSGQAPARDDQSASGGAPQTTAPVPGPHAESAANASPGRVLAAGPGYSIKASGARGSVRQVSNAATRGIPLERLQDPIICQGARLLHIDNRNLQFDGDAVSAEQGCELHITNSHITARGVGVLARGANVHIENSEIEGDGGAIDASDGAQIYAASSRFKGLTRRLESSAFHDLGGNTWN